MWLLTSSGWPADDIRPATTAPDRDSPMAQVWGNTWHWSTKTWASPLRNPLLIHGDAWRLSLGQRSCPNRLNCDWKWQSRIVCYAFSNYVVQSTQGKNISKWLCFSCCSCHLGECNIYHKHLPFLPYCLLLGLLPWFWLLLFRGAIPVWPKFSLVNPKIFGITEALWKKAHHHSYSST